MGIFDRVSNFFMPKQQPVTPQALAWKGRAPVAYTPAAPYVPAPVIVQPKPVAAKPKAKPANRPVASKPKAQVKAQAPVRRAKVATKKRPQIIEETPAPGIDMEHLSDQDFSLLAEAGVIGGRSFEPVAVQPAAMDMSLDMQMEPAQAVTPTPAAIPAPVGNATPWSNMDYPWKHPDHPDNNGGWGPIDVSDKARQNPEFQKLYAALSNQDQISNIYSFAKERLGSVPREDPRMQAIYAHYLANSGNTN